MGTAGSGQIEGGYEVQMLGAVETASLSTLSVGLQIKEVPVQPLSGEEGCHLGQGLTGFVKTS